MNLVERAVLAAVLLTVACQEKVPEPDPPPKPEPVSVDDAPLGSASAPPIPEVTKLEKKDVVEGKGEAAKTGDTVRVHYTGRLLSGKKFDSSRDRDEPFEFELGAREVIRGWDEGVVGMKKGGKQTLLIPSELAYGEQGRPPTIPPNSPLEFEIELIEIVN